MVERQKNLELKKHVATIHSTNKLTLLQRKIANALLFNAYEELLKKDEHAIHIATLCNLIGYDSNDHKTIKKALVNLLATVIEWNLVDGNKLDMEGIWNASSIIADASIHGPICTYSYSNKMKRLLYQPELYGRLNMLVQAKFQSSYGLALYENCVRFQSIEQTPWFDIIKFRKLMGVEDGKYRIFRDFKNRVLNKAIEEVNKYSTIHISPHFRKQGRQVVSIQFAIKRVQPMLAEKPLNENMSLSDILKLKFGLSKKQIEEVMSHYEKKYILEKIAVIESSSSFLQGKIANLAKYLYCAIKDDYQPNKKSNLAKNISDNKPAVPSNIHLNQNKAEEYRRFQNKKILQAFASFSKHKQDQLLVDFEKNLGKSIYHDIYLRDGLKNILIQDQLCLFIRQYHSSFLDNIPSFEAFCDGINCSM